MTSYEEHTQQHKRGVLELNFPHSAFLAQTKREQEEGRHLFFKFDVKTRVVDFTLSLFVFLVRFPSKDSFFDYKKVQFNVKIIIFC